jgi:WD40 repeat protein
VHEHRRIEKQEVHAQVRNTMLAVGYGQQGLSSGTRGHICVFSTKDPGKPLRAFPTRAGVTALDWSLHSGSLLAVGLSDGTLAVWDIRNHKVGRSSCGRP